MSVRIAGYRPLLAAVPRLAAVFVSLAVLPTAAHARGSVVEDWYGTGGDSWKLEPSLDFKGWSSTSTDSGYAFAKAGADGRTGLSATAIFNPHAPLGTGEWQWQAPGTSTIYRADYGAASFNKEGCLNEGLRRSSGAWQPTVNFRAGAAPGAASVHPTACGANGTVTSAPVTTKDGKTAVTIVGAPDTQTFCSDAAGCGLERSPIANIAVFGVQRIKQGRPGFEAYLPGAKLHLTDYDVPLIKSAANSHPRWVKSVRGTVTVVASDTGLGVNRASVSHATSAGPATNDAQTHTCGGDRNDRCPATWNADRPDWTTNWSYDTDAMPEGIQPYGLALRDIVDNRTPASGEDTTAIPVSKIDRSAPDPVTGTGQIPALDGQWFLGDGIRTIDAAAHDTYSGVESIRIEKTDGTVLDEATFSCPDDQCPRDVLETLAVDTTQLPEGETTVRVRVTDLVGNTATTGTWALKIDRSNPIEVAGSGELVTRDGSYVNGQTDVSLSATAADQFSGVEQLALLDANDEVVASAALGCEIQCPGQTTQELSFNTSALREGAQPLRLRALDLVGHHAATQPWTLYVDRTGPAFGPAPALDEDDGDSGGLTPDPDSGTSLAEWDPAVDPALADGTEGSGTASYTVRYRPTGSEVWSSAQTVTDTRAAVDSLATSIELELVATDAVGNAGSPVVVTVKGFEQDPEPIPADTPSTELVEGIPGDTRDEEESGGEVNEEYGAQARGAVHNPGSRHYTCNDEYGPIQAWPSGFVFGVCEPDTEVHSFDLATWPKKVDKDGNETGFPGTLSEGYQWAGVALPPESTFNGCGWMSTKKRLTRGGSDDTRKCKKTSYKLGDFVRASSDRPAGTPAAKNILHRGLLIWSSIKMKADGTRDLRDGKVQEVNGRPWKSKGTCQAYANINPWKRGQTARGPIELEDGTPFEVEEGDTTTIRYMSRFTAKNPETGNYVFWVMIHSSSKYAPWAWVSAPCIF